MTYRLAPLALLATTAFTMLPLSLVACDDDEEGNDGPTEASTVEPTDAGADTGSVGPQTLGAGPYSIAYSATGPGIDLRPDVSATFLPNGELDGYKASDQEAPTKGTAKAAEIYMDAKSLLGRWNDGTTGGVFYSQTNGFALSATQGFHYALVEKASALPSAGPAELALASATAPTIDDGSLAVGTLTGTAGAAWAGEATKLGFDLTVTMPGDATYTIKTTGGWETPATTEVNVFNTSLFATAQAGDVPVTSTGVACSGGSACKAIIDGAVGKDGDRLAVAVMISSGGTTKVIRAAAVFAKPPL